MQLLPASEGVRKCIVSVRSHDFNPVFAMADISTADGRAEISECLALVFEQYINELPAKAADKMRKEKLAAKKQSRAGPKAAKAPTAPTQPPTTRGATAAVPNQSIQSQGGLFAS